MELPSYVSSSGDRVFIDVYVQPRAAAEGIVGIHGRALKVKVKPPPLDGRANEAVERLIAETLRLAPRQVSVVTGERSRNKRLEVVGTTLVNVTSELARVVSSHAHEPG